MTTVKRVRRRIKRQGAGWILAGAILAMVACSGGGQVIPADRRIPFMESGTHSGQWESMEASVAYRYSMDSQAAGKLRVSGSVTARYRLAQLKVLMQFLDAEGRVLSSKQVYSSGYRRQNVGGEFKRTLDLPEGTAGLAFSSHAQPHRGNR